MSMKLMNPYFPNSYSKRCVLCNHSNDACSHVLNVWKKLKLFFINKYDRLNYLIVEKTLTFKENVSHFKENLLVPSPFNVVYEVDSRKNSIILTQFLKNAA